MRDSRHTEAGALEAFRKAWATVDEATVRNVSAVAAGVGARIPKAKTYLVGGAVRDLFLGGNPNDYDLLVAGASVEDLSRALPEVDGVVEVDIVGKSFGVFKAKFSNGEIIDVALPRKEVSTGPGHRDFDVTTDPNLTVEDDLSRRDFTVNAIAVRIDGGQPVAVVDPYRGVLGIYLQRIETVGPPEDRFAEDPLRILRAYRFASRLPGGFHIALAAKLASQKLRGLLANVSPDRIGEELGKIFKGRYTHEAISEMHTFGVLSAVIPEWEESRGFEQNSPYHYATVAQHVLDALAFASENGFSPRAKLAVLLHDIAKPRTYSVDERGIGHFYGHEVVGYRMTQDILRRLRFPEKEVQAVATIVRNHLRPPKAPSDKALRKYVAQLGDLWEDALQCKAADLSAHRLPEGFSVPEWYTNIRERCEALPKDLGGFQQRRLALSGREIINAFGVRGREVGRIKEHATQAVIEGRVPNEATALLDFLRGEVAAGHFVVKST